MKNPPRKSRRPHRQDPPHIQPILEYNEDLIAEDIAAEREPDEFREDLKRRGRLRE